jgi:hypothetical protein
MQKIHGSVLVKSTIFRLQSIKSFRLAAQFAGSLGPIRRVAVLPRFGTA